MEHKSSVHLAQLHIFNMFNSEEMSAAGVSVPSRGPSTQSSAEPQNTNHMTHTCNGFSTQTRISFTFKRGRNTTHV